MVIADYKKPQPEVLQQLPSNVLFVHTDVSSWPSMIASFDACIEKFGAVDYVFANAGIGELEHLFEDHFGKDGKLLGMSYTAIDVKYDAQSLDHGETDLLTNASTLHSLKGVLNTVKLAVHWFRKLKVPGHIVMTSSMSGYETPGIPIYVSSKVCGPIRLFNSESDSMEAWSDRNFASCKPRLA